MVITVKHPRFGLVKVNTLNSQPLRRVNNSGRVNGAFGIPHVFAVRARSPIPQPVATRTLKPVLNTFSSLRP